MQNKLKQLEKKYSIDWRNEKAGNYFEVRGNPQLNKDSFNFSENGEYPYFTRTVLNNGVAGYVDYFDEEHKISGNSIAVGMFGMQFFYMERDFYAGQFTKTLFPRFEGLNRKNVDYFISLLNKHQVIYQGSLVRHFEKLFNETELKLPFTHDKLNLDYIEEFISTLEAERLATLEAYLKATGLKDVELSEAEAKSLQSLDTTGGAQIEWREFKFSELFDNIQQGARLTKANQIKGNIPYVMSGVTNTGVVGYISNPVRKFPNNSLTIDIFGNTFYRDYDFGAGDDTGVFWNSGNKFDKPQMLFLASVINKFLAGKYDYGHKLRASKTLDFEIKLPVTSDNILDYNYMSLVSSATQKIVIKNVVAWLDKRIEATKQVISN